MGCNKSQHQFVSERVCGGRARAGSYPSCHCLLGFWIWIVASLCVCVCGAGRYIYSENSWANGKSVFFYIYYWLGRNQLPAYRPKSHISHGGSLNILYMNMYYTSDGFTEKRYLIFPNCVKIGRYGTHELWGASSYEIERYMCNSVYMGMERDMYGLFIDVIFGWLGWQKRGGW